MSKSVYASRLFRDLWKHKGQVLILTVILAIGGGCTFGISLMTMWRGQNIHNFYTSHYLDDGIISFPQLGGVNRSLILEKLNNFSNRDLIDQAELRYQASISFKLDSENLTIIQGLLYGRSLVSYTVGQLDTLFIKNGRNFTASDTNETRIIIDSDFAKDNNLSLGDLLTVRLGNVNKTVNVIGISMSPEWVTVIDPNAVSFAGTNKFGISYVLLDTLQSWLGIPDNVNELVIKAKSGVDIADLGKKLMTYFTDQGFICEFDKRTDMATYRIIEDDIKNDNEMFSTLALVVFLVALFGLWISLNRLIVNQQREIGIDLSLGVPRSKIMLHYIFYGIWIGILGGICSLPFGYFFGMQFANIIIEFYSIPFLDTPINWEFYQQSAWLCVGCSLLASWWPARQASSLLPVTALRQDAARAAVGFKKNKHIKLHKSAQGGLNARLAFRNIFRNQKRTAATVMGFAFSVMLLIAIIGMFDSMDNFTAQYENEMGNWNMRVTLYQPMPTSYLKPITNESGVIQYQYGIVYFANLHFYNQTSQKNDTKMIQIQGFSATYLKDGNYSSEVLMNNESVMTVSREFAKSYNLSQAENITIEHYAFSGQSYKIQNSSLHIGAYHDRAVKIDVFIPWAELERIINKTNIANEILIYGEEEELLTLRERFYLLSYVKLVEFHRESVNDIREGFASLKEILNLVQIIGYCLVFGVILLTSIITRLERTRETGTMATLGASDWTQLRIALWEAFYISILGISIGIGLGWLLLDWYLLPVMRGTIPDYLFLSTLNQNTLIQVSILALILGLVSQIPIIFKLRSMDLSQATKVRDF